MIDSMLASRLGGSLALLVAALSASGCASAPAAGAGRFDSQGCVEQALRGEPDLAVLPIAEEEFRSACDRGNGAACSALGVMFELGQGVSRNTLFAMDLYRRACERGNARGCANLAGALIKDGASPGAIATAVALLTRTCHGRAAVGCGLLGRMTAQGIGVEKSTAAAYALFARACASGDGESCRYVGDALSLEDGDGSARALELFVKACVAGDAEGCARMAGASPAAKQASAARDRAAPSRMSSLAGEDSALLAGELPPR
jgi:TPR repeat protein